MDTQKQVLVVLRLKFLCPRAVVYKVGGHHQGALRLRRRGEKSELNNMSWTT